MKLIILLAFISSTFAIFNFDVDDEIIQSWEKLAEPHTEECIAESKVEKQDVIEFFSKKSFPTERPHQCFSKCLFSHLGFYNLKTRNFNIDLLVEKVKGLTKEIADECYSKYNDEKDDCSKVFHSVMCATKKISKPL